MRQRNVVLVILAISLAQPAFGQWIGGSGWGRRRAWSNRGPANVTWYTVGGGYSSALPTGLPWRRQFATYDRPFTLPMEPGGTGSVARYSRVTSRDFYARAVNLPDVRSLEPSPGSPAVAGSGAESNVEIVRGSVTRGSGDKQTQLGTPTGRAPSSASPSPPSPTPSLPPPLPASADQKTPPHLRPAPARTPEPPSSPN